MTEEEKKALDDLQTAAKAIHDEADQSAIERKKFGDQLGETTGKIDKLNTRIDELETKLARPPAGSPAEEKTIKDQKQVQTFIDLMRKGKEGAIQSGHTPEELKSFISSDDPNGGYTLPPATRGKMIELATHISPVRGLASVEAIKGTEWECPRELSLLAIAKAGETTAPAETGTVSDADWFGVEKIITHKMYASPYISQDLLDDSEYDLESFLMNRMSKVFGIEEADWFINGDGDSEAEGMLTNSTVDHYHNGHATVLQADNLIAYTYYLHEYYEKNASFLMRRASLGLVRAIKDAVSGAYLWQPAFAAGQPATILGYPVYQCADMPSVSSATYPMIFGDIKAAYKIIDRKILTVLRDPYSHKPYIQFYATRRVGGSVVDPNAIIKLYMAT